MMKNVIWLIIALIVGTYFYNAHRENSAKREVQRLERERIEKDTKASIQQLVSRTNAVEDWGSRLSEGKTYRMEPILTVELERLWIVERPILFIGSIHDIKTHDETSYEVLVERNLLSSLGNMFRTDLQLSLIAPMKQIDTFLEEHPNLREGISMNNGIAIAAKVNSVETAHIAEEEGFRKEVKVGHGSLIDLEHVGSVRL